MASRIPSILIALDTRRGERAIRVLVSSNTPLHTFDVVMIEFIRLCSCIKQTNHPLSSLIASAIPSAELVTPRSGPTVSISEVANSLPFDTCGGLNTSLY